jgi:hypothetical protein
VIRRMRSRRLKASSGRLLGSLLATWILGAGCTAAIPEQTDAGTSGAMHSVEVPPHLR